jgi:tetratricopeptide (TPR) repeat protein
MKAQEAPPAPPPPPAAMAFQPTPPAPPAPPKAPRAPLSARRDDYQRGKSALDKRDYAGAVRIFQSVIDSKSDRSDGALYWRAYAENKLGKRAEALASLAELQKSYAGSPWIEDAHALEVEVRQASGTPQSPESASDDDLKILVLNGMIDSDPARSIPVLEQLLKGKSSPQVKERALFVLAQGGSPKSREVIASVAKGKYNPDLQMKAVEFLGMAGGKENGQLLADIYKASGDAQLKRAVLRGFMMSGNRDALLSAAKSESNAELRIEAIRQLGMMGGSADLLQMYTPDAPVAVRRAILEGLFMGGNSDKIVEIARGDKDPEMRREAVHRLGMLGHGKAADALPAIYAKETDANVKQAVLQALFIQSNAPPLIEIARKETDRHLKETAIRNLSMMHSKEASDYLMELLNK